MIRNEEDMEFWNVLFLQKTFLVQSLWIFKWVSWWCHSLTIFYTFCLQKWIKKIIFQPRDSFDYPLSTQTKWEIMFSILTHFKTGVCFYLFLPKNQSFHNFMYDNYIWQIVRHDITNPLIWIFIRTGQDICFSKKAET